MLKITVLALGSKMPDWVDKGTQEYVKRLNDGVQLKIIEIPLIKRSKSSDLVRIMEKEALLIQQSIPSNSYLIALDSTGKTFKSEELAAKIDQLQQKSSHLCLLIGGPEGFLPQVLKQCQERWSLSSLTLPHPLVRIVLAEVLYRAWTIINNHPYHK